MPYKPFAVDERQKSQSFRTIWLGAAGSLAALLLRIFMPQLPTPAILIGFPVGGLLASALAWQSDDYFRALCAMGHKFMAAFLAIYTFAAWMGENFVPAGSLRWLDGLIIMDGYFIALCTMTAFYTGYAYAWLRDRF